MGLPWIGREMTPSFEFYTKLVLIYNGIVEMRNSTNTIRYLLQLAKRRKKVVPLLFTEPSTEWNTGILGFRCWCPPVPASCLSFYNEKVPVQIYGKLHAHPWISLWFCEFCADKCMLLAQRSFACITGHWNPSRHVRFGHSPHMAWLTEYHFYHILIDTSNVHASWRGVLNKTVMFSGSL